VRVVRASTVDILTLHNAMGQQSRPLQSLLVQVLQRRLMLGENRNHFTTGRIQSLRLSRALLLSRLRVRLYTNSRPPAEDKLASTACGWK
jgi:hypothetical protein